jgi:hypothetical protein
MRNFDESRREQELRREEVRKDQDVIPFERKTFGDMQQLRERWVSIQSSFVDNPRQAIGEAESLVTSAIKRIEDRLNSERMDLEKGWKESDDTSTEDLRVSLQRYREFFDRLTAM